MVLTCKLYRLFDKNNELLYVGISLSEIARLQQHQSAHKNWFDDISRVEIESFNSVKEAAIAEKQTIISERPKYNIHHNSTVTYQSDFLQCELCGKPLSSIRKSKNPRFTQRFCSAKCRIESWERLHPRVDVNGNGTESPNQSAPLPDSVKRI